MAPRRDDGHRGDDETAAAAAVFASLLPQSPPLHGLTHESTARASHLQSPSPSSPSRFDPRRSCVPSRSGRHRRRRNSSSSSSSSSSAMSDSFSRAMSCQALSPRSRMQRVLMAVMMVVCGLCDLLIFLEVFPNEGFTGVLLSLVDSAGHFTVGFCAWGIFLCFSHDWRIPTEASIAASASSSAQDPAADPPQQRARWRPPPDPSRGMPGWRHWRAFLMSCICAALMAALLDLDHFIAAGALSISGAKNLTGRPFGHSLTFILGIILIVLLYSKFYDHASKPRVVHRVSFVISALLGHQIRDAMRRGLWLWPLGSTPAIFYPFYLIMELALPVLLGKWQLSVNPSGSRDPDAEPAEDENRKRTTTHATENHDDAYDDENDEIHPADLVVIGIGHGQDPPTAGQHREYRTPVPERNSRALLV